MRKQPVENKIYAAIIELCEEKEHDGVYRGNGHHFAQQLTAKVSEGLLAPNQKKVYDALTGIPTPTKELSAILKKPSKTISAILIQMEKKTLLVLSKRKGNLRLWYKAN